MAEIRHLLLSPDPLLVDVVLPHNAPAHWQKNEQGIRQKKLNDDCAKFSTTRLLLSNEASGNVNSNLKLLRP